MAQQEQARTGPRMRPGLIATLVVLAVAACAAETPPRAEAPAAAAAERSPLGSYLAARHAQQNHDYAAAARMMERALADDPGNFDLVRRAFVLRVSQGDADGAVPLARQIVAHDGNAGLAGVVLVVAAIKAADFETAAKQLQGLAPDGAQRYAVPLLGAWIEAARQHPGPAQQSLQSLTNPRGLEPLRDLHLGLIADGEGQKDAALEAYRKLLAEEAQPTWHVVEVVGNFYERHAMTGEARALYTRYAAQDAETDAAAAALARLKAGTVPPRLVASPRQGAAEALFDLASLLNQPETADVALIYARLALTLEPRLPLALLLAAEIRESQNQIEDALALYGAIDPSTPLAWSARLRAALALDSLNRTDEAVKQLRAMADERPDRNEPLVELGDILRAHNRFDEAAKAYDGAIARLPGADKVAWRLYYDRGVTLERSGQWPRAEADLKRALELQPEQPMVLNYLGYSWIDKGQNLSDALKMVQHAVELRPNDGYIVDSLGWAYFRLGDFTNASQYLQRAIELLPEDPTINDHLGDVYWRTGRLAEARYQWRRALQFKPEPGDVQAIQTKLDKGLTTPQATNGG